MSDKLKFNKGDKVFRRCDPGRRGEITGRTKCKANDIYYLVNFPDGEGYVPEYELDTQKNINYEDMIEQRLFGRVSDIRRNLTHALLSGRLSNLIYSLDATKTDFYPHQFKPVLAFLESPSRGLLIADEVGLGKTIEAGLIWTELRARYDYRRVLVVCPAMLREKWRDELRDRFGVDATIMDATQLLTELKRPLDSIPDGKGIICSIQGIRPPREQQHQKPVQSRHKLAQFFEEQTGYPPIIDLLIIDEAHYLRNRSSQSAHLGKMLRGISENVLLLSATPINLKSEDLFSLLNIVDPDTFSVPEFFPAVLRANEPLVKARKLVLNPSVQAEDIWQCLNEASEHDFLRGNSQLKHIMNALQAPASVATNADRVQLADRIEKVNLYRHVLNRTRKAEVIELKVVRSPHSQFVKLKSVEREFYDKVTNAVRGYAQEAGINDGFLLASPQRQVSSCLYAAAESWNDKVHINEHLDEMIYEDTGGEVSDASMLSPFMDYLTSRVLPVDLQELRKHDSKFKVFDEVIEKYLNDHPQKKIVVFSYFRATLFYLEERLREQGIVSQVLVGGMKENKQDAISRFREDGLTKVLLSSEVASEGVDLQFCSMIVNYDLPWNPMKIEQRIGRLDRIGQKADKIVIWNFGHADTIDQRIYEKLFDRLEIFERALGGMEAVLGEKIKELTDDLISHQLTPQEEARMIEQTASAIEKNRQTEEILEQEASSLIAHSGYILERVKTAHNLKKGISNEDLIIYIRDYLNKHSRGHEFRQPGSDKLRVDIKLPARTAAKLGDYIDMKKLRGQTQLATGNRVECKFINKVNVAIRFKEQINQFHPLVRFIREEISSSDFYPVVAVKFTNKAKDMVLSELASGQYAFVIDIWRFGGLRDEEDMQVRALHVESDKELDAEESWKLLNAVRLGGVDWPESKYDISPNMSDKIFDCETYLRYGHNKACKYKTAENEDRINLQITSAEQHRARQMDSQERVLENYRSRNETRMIPATEGKINKIKNKFDVQIERLKNKKEMTCSREPICRGAILLE